MWNYIWRKVVFVPKRGLRLNKQIKNVIQQRRFSHNSLPTAYHTRVHFSNYARQLRRVRHNILKTRFHNKYSYYTTRARHYSSASSQWLRARVQSRWQSIYLQVGGRGQGGKRQYVSLGLGFSSFIVTSASLDKVNLKVPTKEEVDLQTGLASIKNAQFVHGTYEELMSQYIPRFDDANREIVKHLNGILNDCDNYEAEFWSGKIVCEIGSGTGTLAHSIIDKIDINDDRKNSGYIGLDISPAFVYYLDSEFAKRNYNGKGKTRAIAGQNTADSLCLPDNLVDKLDIFILCDTYSYIDNKFTILDEINTFLKPNGKLIIIENQEHDKTVKEELEKAGFDLNYSILDGKLNGQFAYIFSKK